MTNFVRSCDLAGATASLEAVKRTYVDSGVLIAAATGRGRLAVAASRVLADTAIREFVCSDYVRLEVIPKATHENRLPEIAYYEEFFASVSLWLVFDAEHLHMAFLEACRSGLSAMDAIHVVAAASGKCDEMVTMEKPTKPIHRTKLISVLSIDTE
jgi:predicted nucleic acid-binding protein